MQKKLFLILSVIVLAAASRLINHLPNFTPVAAIALFSGFYLPKKYFVVIPLLSMLISDMFIGFYDWRLTAVVYLGIAMTFFIGWFLKRNGSWRKAIAGSLTGSVIFFVITNFAVWAFYNWYPHSLAGLFDCFAMALPFFRNSLLGDLFYTATLFGIYEVTWFFANQKQTKLLKL